MTTTAIDEERLNALIGQLLGDYGATISSALVLLGDRLGLYEQLAKGSLTADQLARSAGTTERFAADWLVNQAASGYVTHDPASGSFSLSAEQALLFADPNAPVSAPGGFQVLTAAVRSVDRIEAAVRAGEGVPWGAHHEDLFEGTRRFFEPGYVASLVSEWLPALDGVTAKLEAGADAGESILAPAPVAAEARARRASALVAMVERSSGAMLNVYVARNIAKVDEDDPFASMKEPQLVTLGLGSGVIIDRSGLALSNWHVVDDATNPDGSMKADHAVTVRVFGGKEYKVKVLSISREDDLSLLQLELDPGEEVHAIDLGNSSELAIGENVAAIGNPHGRANTITFGLVSAKEQGIRVRGRWAKLEHLIETDAAINGGNSGGALLDMNGRLVGINSAGGGTFNNKGYAISVDHVRRQVVGLLFAAYKLRSPDLGMRVLDDEGHVVVMDVDGRGPAAKVGLRSGDRIVELAGTGITWSPGFALTLLRQPANVELELKVERKGEPLTFRLAPMPAVQWGLIRQAGLACRDFGYAEDPEAVRQAAIAIHRQISGDPHGEPTKIPMSLVVVDQVFAHEQPEGTDLKAGDFVMACELKRSDNGAPVFVPVTDVGALRDLFNDRELGSYDGVEFPLWVARGGKVHRVDVRAKRLFW